MLRVWYLPCCWYVTALLLQSQMILRAASWSRLVSCWGLSTSGEVVIGGNLNGMQILLMQNYFSVVNITELLV